MRPLNEKEKIALRLASDDRLMWLFHDSFKFEPSLRDKTDEEGLQAMKELKAKADSAFDNTNPTFGNTWLF